MNAWVESTASATSTVTLAASSGFCCSSCCLSQGAVPWHADAGLVANGCSVAASTGLPIGACFGPPQVVSASLTPQLRYHSSHIPSASRGSIRIRSTPSVAAAAAAVCTHRNSGDESGGGERARGRGWGGGLEGM